MRGGGCGTKTASKVTTNGTNRTIGSKITHLFTGSRHHQCVVRAHGHNTNTRTVTVHGEAGSLRELGGNWVNGKEETGELDDLTTQQLCLECF